MKNPALLLVVIISLHSIAWADGVKTPEQQFDGYETNLDTIPAQWMASNPILLRVCFDLVYPINSDEANAFLHDLQRTISGMKYGVEIRIERTIYPVSEPYCASLAFPDWETNRRYESSEEFLDFYEQRWKPAVSTMREELSVLDVTPVDSD